MRTRAVTIATVALTPLLPLLALTTHASAVPSGSCTVTQHGTTTYSAARDVTLARAAYEQKRRTVRRSGSGWRASTTAKVTWRVSARAAATSRYASQECGVAETPTTASAAHTQRITLTVTRRASAPSREAAVRKARARVTASTRQSARYTLLNRTQDAAFLGARLAFLDTLPESDRTAALPPGARTGARLTGAQVCPAALPRGTNRAAESWGTVVPRFAEPAAIWLCRYPLPDRQGRSKVQAVKVPAKNMKATTAGLRALHLPVGNIACTTEIGDRVLVAHVAADGYVTGTTVDRSGCWDARLTPQPHTVPAGTTSQRGVPSGTYAAPAGLRAVLDALVARG